MRNLLTLTLTAWLLCLTACGEAEDMYYGAVADEKMDQADYDTAAIEVSESSEGLDYDGGASDKVSTTRTSASPTGEIDLPDATANRKIIYNARVDLVVDDFERVPDDVAKLAKKYNGFIARSSIQGSDGEPRVGTWTLRIPSSQYDAFLIGAQTLGQLRSKTSDSREVTAEFVDLEARLRNSRAEEKRLHEHLNESTKSLKDILAIEREIARVRGEIERAEGRLNVLKDLTALSTVTLTIEEIKNYEPAPTEEPGFTTQVARTWDGSTDGLGGFLKGAALFFVSLTPWLVIIVPIGVVVLLVLRRLKRQLFGASVKHAVA